MKKLKQTLAWLLVLCMVASFLPAGVFAATAEAPTNDLTTTGSPFQKGTGESNSFRIPALVTLSDGTLVAAADARWNTTYDGGGLDTMVAISKDNGATWTHSFANYLGDNGNVYNGSSSTCFIDPSLAVLTTDQNKDGIGEDTIFMLVDLYPYGVALNGSGNTAPNTDTGFTDNGKLKLTADGSSYSYYLDGTVIRNSSGTEVSGLTVDAYFNVTGTYNGQTVNSNLFFADSPFKVARTGFLYLTKSTDKGATWSAPQLLNLKNAGEQVCLVGPGRALVTYNGVIVFPCYSYAGESSKYTGLIYSADQGATWHRTAEFRTIISSEATMVNLGNDTGDIRVFFRNDKSALCYVDYVPGSDESTCGMIDGQWGQYVNTGVTCNSDTELSAITYSYGVMDNGVEKTAVLVSAPGGPNGAGSDNNNGAYRTSGKIFMGLIDPNDYNMSWKSNSISVTDEVGKFPDTTSIYENGFFGYSCLTEVYETGSVAILYENSQHGWGAAEDGTTYYTMAYETYTKDQLAKAFGVTFSGDVDIEDETEAYEEDITVKLGETFTENVDGIYVPSDSTENDYVSVTWVGTPASTAVTDATAKLGTNSSYNGDTINVADCLYTFTANGNGFVVQSKSNSSLYLNTTKNAAGCPNANVSNTVLVNAGSGTNTFYLHCAPQSGDNTESNGYLYFWHDGKNRFDRNSGYTGAEAQCSFYLYRPATDGETGSTEIPGYVRVTAAYNAIADGDYLIAHEYNGAYYLLHPSTTTSGDDAGRYPHVAKVTGETKTTGTNATAFTTVTITPKKAGETTVELGNGAIIYNITVDPASTILPVDVQLKINETKEYTIDGAYTSATTAPDDEVVDMDLEVVETVTDSNVGDAVTAITKGKYVIYSYIGSYVINQADGNYIDLSTTEPTVWNVAVADSAAGTYYITDSSGNYLTVGSNTAGVTTDRTAVKLVHGTSNDGPGQSGFFIQDANGSYNLNNSGGTNNAYGKSSSNATGSYSRWQFKPYTGTPSTKITFTGKSLGNTTAVVGDTTFNITVNSNATKVEEVTLKLGETKTYTEKLVNLANSANNVSPNANIAGMELTGSDGVYTKGAFVAIDGLTAGSYIIKNRRADDNGAAGTLVSNTPNSSNNDGLKLEGTESSFGASAVWTITPVGENTYTIRDINGKYMTIGNSTAGVSADETILTFTYTTSNSKYAISKDGYYLNQFGGDTSTRAAGWNGSGAATDEGSRFEIYQFSGNLPFTEVTFEGLQLGKTIAVVGDTQYNITVVPANTEEVKLAVDESRTYEDNTGNYQNYAGNVQPNASIATMTVTGVAGTTETTVSTEKTTELEAGATYIIRVTGTNYAITSNKGGTTWGSSDGDTRAFENYTGPEADNMWTLEASGNGYKLKCAAGYLNLGKNAAWITETGGDTFTLTNDNGVWAIGDGSYNIDALGGLTNYYCAGGWPNSGTRFDLYKVTQTTDYTTTITFTGVSDGTTSAVVGNTLYNITVSNLNQVNIELEIGESFTYTDTTGNFVDKVTQQPDGTYATMAVSGSTNYVKELKEVTALEDGKKYLIVNKGTGQVLSSTQVYVTGQWGDRAALATVDGVSPKSPNFWTVTQAGDGWYVTQNANYLSVAGYVAYAGTTHKNPLTLTYTDNGWTIFDGKTGIDEGHTTTGGYYLVDDMAIDNYTNGAQGHTDLQPNSYWTIYEAVDTAEVESNITNVTFTGLKIGGPVTAVVGNTMYRVTVVALEVDDEIQNIGTNMWNVDPEIQQKAYYSMTNLIKDEYTDASWAPYHQARNEALAKLNEVSGKTYATEAEAEAALAELQELINDLKTAFDALEKAKVITINYQLNGTTILTENYKIDTSATTLPLSDTIVITEGTKTVAYTINEGMHHENEAKYENGILTLPPVDTQVNVAVTKLGTLGSGFLGEQVIEGEQDSDGHTQNAGVYGNKVTAMTVTKGITYDLKIADTLTDGQYVVWESDNESVSTVDDNGVVTAVAPGTANIIAKVYNADGSLASINSIPITVHYINYPESTDTATLRKVGLYIKNIDNTTVYCMINGNVDGVFEVIEGHLIYGYYNKSTGDTTDPNTTTAFTFFGDPDEAHALVAMTSSDSFGHYSQIHDENGNLGNGEQYYYWTNATAGAGYWQAVGLGTNDRDNPNWEAIRKMVEWAIAHGCDGGQGFTRRQAEGPLCQSLTFISDPMPKIEKAVDGVLPTTRKMSDYKRYTENMFASVKEQVYFKITVTLEAPTQWAPELNSDGSIKKENGMVVYRYDENGNRYSAIEYSNSLVTDKILPGAFLYTKYLDNLDGKWDGEVDAEFRTQVDDITEELNAAWTPEELAAGRRVLDYYLVYEIQESDIPKFYIDNIANLSYSYKSHYSTGALAAAADAEARITLVGSAIDSVVIDFGQSVTYQSHPYTSADGQLTYTFEGLTDEHLAGAYYGENSKATATYGDVKVDRTENGEYIVTYTPTSILQGSDAVQIFGVGDNNQEKVINGFLVYPASTIYYEEGFLENVNGWNFDNANKATTDQTFELLGVSQFSDDNKLITKITNKKHAYGFDPIYDGVGNDDVEKSSISANTAGAATKFTFTGTGFEIFADCTVDSGFVNVAVTNTNGDLVKMFTVNTVVKGGDTGATTGQAGAMNALPIVSLKDLAHGTYTVTLTKVMADSKTVAIDGVRITNTISDSSIYTVDLEDNPEFYQLRDAVLHGISIGEISSMDYGLLEYMAKQVYGNISTDGEAPSAILTGNNVQDIYQITSNVITSELHEIKYQSKVVFEDGTEAIKILTEMAIIHKDAAGNTLNHHTLSMGYQFENEDGTPVVIDADKKIESESTREMIEDTCQKTESVLATTQDLLDNGPKNEIYLWPGQTLTFNVATQRVMQVGLKAPRGATSFSYRVGDNSGTGNINGATDMFYYLTTNPVGNINNTYLVSITNAGNDILSITDLKVCDDPNAVLVPLTLEDVTEILLDAGYTDSEPEVQLPFVDVPNDAYYYDPVVWAVKEGITSGISETRFGPDADCSRAQVVTFLWRAAGSPEPTLTKHSFVDVESGSFYEKAVLWAVEKGITAGTDSTHFSPNASCSRSQVVAFLYRAFESPAVENVENPFSDVPNDAWYSAPVLWAVEQNITAGTGDGLFDVNGVCSRAQIVTFLYRAYN